MNKSMLILILLAVQAVHASDEVPAPELARASSIRTRGDVRAEIDAARKAGTLAFGDFGNAVDRSVSTKSRGEVHAELDRYVRSGERARDAVDFFGGA